MKHDLVFNAGEKEMLTLCDNGDIFVKGKKIKKDIEVYKALKEWMEATIPLFGTPRYSLEELEKIYYDNQWLENVVSRAGAWDLLSWIGKNPMKVKKVLKEE